LAHREAISEARKGMKFSPEHCKNISIAKKGHKPPPKTLKTRRKLSKSIKASYIRNPKLRRAKS
jgi:hypothetical protein